MTPIEFAVKTLYWFFLYGFIGWGVEVVYAAVKTHKLVNRGFLCGPICPIYGFGMVGLIYSVSLIPMPDSGSMSAVAIFFIGMILTTAIELVGGWALFKIYHIRWWDYSNMKFNLGGYICPQFSLLWGLGSVLMIKVVHPLLARGSSPMPFNIMLIVDVVLLVLFVVDVAASTAAAIGLNKYLREIDELRAKLRVTSDKLTTVLGTGAMTADTILDEQKLQLALAKLEGRENADVLRAELTIRAAALREKLTSAEHDHLGTRRLLRAFPDMKSLNYADSLLLITMLCIVSLATSMAVIALSNRSMVADQALLRSIGLSPRRVIRMYLWQSLQLAAGAVILSLIPVAVSASVFAARSAALVGIPVAEIPWPGVIGMGTACWLALFLIQFTQIRPALHRSVADTIRTC